MPKRASAAGIALGGGDRLLEGAGETADFLLLDAERRKRLDHVHAVPGHLAEDAMVVEQGHRDQLGEQAWLAALDRLPQRAGARRPRAGRTRSPTSARARAPRARPRSARRAARSARAAALRAAARAPPVPRARARAASPAPQRRPGRCRRRSSRGGPRAPSRRRRASKAERETSTAPIGTSPPDSALARQIMSGSSPQCSRARKRPVRPSPVWTSSQTNSVPASRHSRWAAAR